MYLTDTYVAVAIAIISYGIHTYIFCVHPGYCESGMF